MNYPYPIPGSGGTPVQSPENWFHVGNECCNGSIWKDVEATVRIFFDYSDAMANVPGGNTITSVTLEVTTVGDGMITVFSPSMNGEVKAFLVSGGVVGGQYGIEAVAALTDGQVWIDHITVNITDCTAGPATSGGMLLSTLGPIAISNTLYYAAAAGQTIFYLDTPDKFGHTGTLVDSNVLVYEAGGRQVPYDNYNVNIRANSISFTNPLTVGEIAVFDIVTPRPPPQIYPPPVLLTGGVIATSLYYFASNGQTVFSLSTPDRFNHVGSIATAGGNALVYVDGLRKEPIDDYTILPGANTITFTSPVTAGAEVDFDLVTAPPAAPVIPPPVVLTDAAIAFTLYYSALGGQTMFPLGVPDVFGHVATLTVDGALVSRNGLRLVPNDSFTFDVVNNQIILAYPAGTGESVIIDLVTPPLPPPTITGAVPRTENLIIATLNTIPVLAYAPDGGMLMLFVNGTAFFSPTSFTVSGHTLTWVSTLFSIPVGAAVTAVYTHA